MSPAVVPLTEIDPASRTEVGGKAAGLDRKSVV